jgi:hydroxymethylpyrimidine pyrophosphatase-like HAD family hydrolase
VPLELFSSSTTTTLTHSPTMSSSPPLPKPEGINLIVCDVDGTLLDSHHGLPETNPTHVVLRRIRDTHPNLPIVVSTGKPYPATAGLRSQLSLDNFNAIHLNGNVIYAPDGTVISQTGLDTSVVLAVYEVLKEAGISLFVYDTDRPWQVLPYKTVGDKPWDEILAKYGEDVQSIDRAEEAMARVRSGEFKVVKLCSFEIESYIPSTSSF